MAVMLIVLTNTFVAWKKGANLHMNEPKIHECLKVLYALNGILNMQSVKSDMARFKMNMLLVVRICLLKITVHITSILPKNPQTITSKKTIIIHFSSNSFNLESMLSRSGRESYEAEDPPTFKDSLD